MKKFMNRKQSGVTLIELLLVVGLAAIIIGGMFVAYNKVQSTNAANTESNNISTLRAGIKNLFGTSVNYSQLGSGNTGVGILINARAVPDSMRTAGSTDTIFNTFGGAVTVASTSFNGGTNNAFNIVYNNVPADVCSKLVIAVAQSFNRVQVGGTEVKNTHATTGNDVNIPSLTAACDVDAGATVTLTSL